MRTCIQCGEQFTKHPTMGYKQFERQRFCSKACRGAHRSASRPLCSVDDCERVHSVHGLCDKHFQRLKRRGTVAEWVAPSAEERFWRSVSVGAPNDCWEWHAQVNRHGYGVISVANSSIFSHRFSYSLATGEEIDGWVIRHRCDNPPCVNPAHLLRGTQADNIADAKERGRLNLDGLKLGTAARRARLTERSR